MAEAIVHCMAEARVLYGGQGGSNLYGGGSCQYCGGRLMAAGDSLPHWLFLSKLCLGDGFPGINSASQLSSAGYSFLVLDTNRFF